MTALTDQSVTLPSGRRISYNEYGDPHGRPLLLLHALFFSRTFGEPVDAQAAERGIRVITPDRPGVGRSDFYPWTFDDYPAELAAFADALDIGEFAVVGVSGGGAHALACAWQIPDRLTGVGVVSSVAPPVPEVLSELSWTSPMKNPARRLPWLWRPQMALQSFMIRLGPGPAVAMMERMFGPSDRAILARPEIRSYFTAGIRESFRQGGRGWALEARRSGSEPWQSWLGEITVPVHLWQGDEDRLNRPVMGEYLADAIPDCRPTVVQGAGHLWGIDHMNEVFDVLFAN